jgi:hypothetical protein
VPRPGRSSVTGRGLETGDRFACSVADLFSPSYNPRVIASTLLTKRRARLPAAGDAASQATLGRCGEGVDAARWRYLMQTVSGLNVTELKLDVTELKLDRLIDDVRLLRLHLIECNRRLKEIETLISSQAS